MFDRETGYIKLYRQSLSSPLWQSLNDWRLAETILLMANWKPGVFQSRNGDRINVERGELVTSLPSLSKASSLSIQSVRTSLAHLEKCEFLTGTSTAHYRKISIVNFGKYQDEESPSNRQSNRGLTGTQQRYKKNKEEQKTTPLPTEAKPALDPCTGREALNSPPNSAPPPAPDGFTEFWTAYPRKVAKQAAARAWAKLAPTPDLQTRILMALDAQKRGQDWLKDGGKFIPYPASWLNGARWEDEIAPIGGTTNGRHASSLYS